MRTEVEVAKEVGELTPRRTTVAANARLTSAFGAVIFLLLAVEGVTIVFIGRLTTAHVVLGMVLVPPVLVKLGSTTYRFVKYYRGDPAFRRKGPPPIVLRLLGPVLAVLTVLVIGSGVLLLFVPHSLRSGMMFIHKASFVLWFGVTTIHVLGHLGETLRLAPRDWLRRTRRDVAGASGRQWLLASSLALGLLLGVVVAPRVGGFVAGGFGH